MKTSEIRNHKGRMIREQEAQMVLSSSSKSNESIGWEGDLKRNIMERKGSFAFIWPLVCSLWIWRGQRMRRERGRGVRYCLLACHYALMNKVKSKGEIKQQGEKGYLWRRVHEWPVVCHWSYVIHIKESGRLRRGDEEQS